MSTNFRNRAASQHNFAMIPRADIPRSTYLLQQNRKQTFNGGDLVPIYCEEMVPGDHFRGNSSIFARFATPITPVLDNAEMETFFFAVPCRILWEHWEDFMAGGNYTVPQIVAREYLLTNSIYDHFGLPTIDQLAAAESISINALPLRAYNLIYNEWFRDQNLVTPLTVNKGDGPDPQANYQLRKRMKKHDYFTSCLPWPQKGTTAVTLPLGDTAPVIADTSNPFPSFTYSPSLTSAGVMNVANASNAPTLQNANASGTGQSLQWQLPGLLTDLSLATAATINDIRTAFQTQRYLERMARGGSRYTEIVQSQFGVTPQDARLQRPEYIGGGRLTINTHPIPQTSSSDVTTPQGNLAAYTTASGSNHNFNYAATEHCYIIGIANVRTHLTYQQGLRRHWKRLTNLDFYTPVFAHLGEQAVLQQEIFATGTDAADNTVFGYQERWAEMRYTPNEITGYFRSTSATPIDIWHYSEEFATPPGLNQTFMEDPSQAVLERSMAVGDEAAGQQVLLDILHSVKATRPMPTYSVPGLIDHF